MGKPGSVGGGVIGADRGNPAMAERRETRVGRRPVRLPVDTDRRVLRNRDAAAQAIEREALGQRGGGGAFTIEQQVAPGAFGIWPDDEVEQRLALRAEQSGPDGEGALHVTGHEALQEGGNVLALVERGQAHHGAGRQSGCAHA